MIKLWHETAWADYEYWQAQDNLSYMRAFAEAWNAADVVAIVQQTVAQLPWGHTRYRVLTNPSAWPNTNWYYKSTTVGN